MARGINWDKARRQRNAGPYDPSAPRTPVTNLDMRPPLKLATVARRERQASEAARQRRERVKGRLEMCSMCGEFFRSTSVEVGVSICPFCRTKGCESGSTCE